MVLSSEKKEHPGLEGQLDLIFRALGDQTRRALLARLADKPAMVTELAQPFAMSLPAYRRFWEGTLDSLARYVEDDAEKQT